MSKKVLR